MGFWCGERRPSHGPRKLFTSWWTLTASSSFLWFSSQMLGTVFGKRKPISCLTYWGFLWVNHCNTTHHRHRLHCVILALGRKELGWNYWHTHRIIPDTPFSFQFGHLLIPTLQLPLPNHMNATNQGGWKETWYNQSFLIHKCPWLASASMIDSGERVMPSLPTQRA